MILFNLISLFHLIIFNFNISLLSCSNSLKINIRKLSNSICNIKNCLACDNRNECIKCKEGYQLDNKRCYSKNCEIYGFCKYCDEYDCLKCIKGYKLNYGICDIKER